MIRLDIPNWGIVELKYAIFDLNGTLAVDGCITPEVINHLSILRELISVQVLTAGTQGNLAFIRREADLPCYLVRGNEEKRLYVEQLGAHHVIAFGNGETDIGMLEEAAIGVAVLGIEGVATRAMQVADVVVMSPIHAIDLLLKPKRLISTLRR
jgi:soluble P-type ATPase